MEHTAIIKNGSLIYRSERSIYIISNDCIYSLDSWDWHDKPVHFPTINLEKALDAFLANDDWEGHLKWNECY